RHQLATTTANMAPSAVAMSAIGLLSSPRSISTLLKKPRPGKASNIHRQVSAMITVAVIHCSSKRPRKKVRPRPVTLTTSAVARLHLGRGRRHGPGPARPHEPLGRPAEGPVVLVLLEVLLRRRARLVQHRRELPVGLPHHGQRLLG